MRGQRILPRAAPDSGRASTSELRPTDRERSSIPCADGWKIGSLRFKGPLTVGASRVESRAMPAGRLSIAIRYAVSAFLRTWQGPMTVAAGGGVVTYLAAGVAAEIVAEQGRRFAIASAGSAERIWVGLERLACEIGCVMVLTIVHDLGQVLTTRAAEPERARSAPWNRGRSARLLTWMSADSIVSVALFLSGALARGALGLGPSLGYILAWAVVLWMALRPFVGLPLTALSLLPEPPARLAESRRQIRPVVGSFALTHAVVSMAAALAFVLSTGWPEQHAQLLLAIVFPVHLLVRSYLDVGWLAAVDASEPVRVADSR